MTGQAFVVYQEIRAFGVQGIAVRTAYAIYDSCVLCQLVAERVIQIGERNEFTAVTAIADRKAA